VVDELAARIGGRLRRHKRARANVLEGRLGSRRVVLVQPTTFMNDVGQAVAPLRDFYRVDVDAIVAVHDELDLPFGAIRLKLGGGDNGHNGLRSMRRSLGSGDFFRVRFGIGRPPGRLDPAVFVLRDFSATERNDLALNVGRTADAVTALVHEGLPAAQNQFND